MKSNKQDPTFGVWGNKVWGHGHGKPFGLGYGKKFYYDTEEKSDEQDPTYGVWGSKVWGYGPGKLFGLGHGKKYFYDEQGRKIKSTCICLINLKSSWKNLQFILTLL